MDKSIKQGVVLCLLCAGVALIAVDLVKTITAPQPTKMEVVVCPECGGKQPEGRVCPMCCGSGRLIKER